MSELEYNVNNRLIMLKTVREVLVSTKQDLDRHEIIKPSSKAVTSEEAEIILKSREDHETLEKSLYEAESDEDRLEASIIETFEELRVEKIYFGADVKNPDQQATLGKREVSIKKFRSKGIQQMRQTHSHQIYIDKNG